jgi:hypothetical protein
MTIYLTTTARAQQYINLLENVTTRRGSAENKEVRRLIRFQHPHHLNRQLTATGPMYFVFCRLYPSSHHPPRQRLGHLSTHN